MSQQQRNALPIGEKLQNYRIEGILGSGGFGITYMGIESVTERKVAIKEFMPSNIAVRDSDSRSIQPISESERKDFDWGLDRFRQEAKVLITLIHPNIVPVLNYFEANGTGYLVMAYQEGDSLAALLRPNKTLAQSEIDEILLPTLDGLATIHDAGFLHRDIKPDNIFIRSDGTPVIIDFGSARLALSQHTRGLTAIVSEGYAPFEQYQNDGNQGPWSDIYALGATLYRCITGRRPAEATARIAAAVKGSADPLIPTGELAGPGYSATLLTTIDAALAVDEAKRPQNAAAMREMLAGQIVADKVGATLLAGATPSSETMLVGGAATIGSATLEYGSATAKTTPAGAQQPAPDKTLQPDAGIGAPSGATVTQPDAAGVSAAASAAAATAAQRSKQPRKLLWPAVAVGVLIAGGASAYVAIEKPWEPEQVAAVKTGKDALKTADPTDAEAKRKAEEEKRRADEARRETEKREAARKAEDLKKQAEAEKQRKAEEAKKQAAEAEARRKAEAADADRRRQAAEAEARRKAAEEETRKRAEAEARKNAAEAEARRKAAAEAKRQAAEAEARKQAAEAEQRRKAAAEAARRQAAEEARKRALEAQRKAAAAEARRKAAIDAARKKALEAERRKTYAQRVEEQRKAREARRKRLEAARKAAAERRKKQLAARNAGSVATYLPGRRISYSIQSGRGEETWGMTISFSAGGGAYLSCNYQDMFGRYGACDGYIEGRARWTARGNSVCVRFRGGKQHCFGAVKRGARWSLIPQVRGARLRSFR